MPGTKRTPTTVSAAPVARDSAAVVWTTRERVSRFPAPYCWAMTTVAPEETPTKKPRIRLMTEAVAPPTAPRAFMPTKLPTTRASTVLYICWKKVPRATGRKKSRICFQMTPVRRAFSWGRFVSMEISPFVENVRR